jgi:SWI/SNF-related matrix-associated actin-dependent regulator 1 of chromatin subfamily A
MSGSRVLVQLSIVQCDPPEFQVSTGSNQAVIAAIQNLPSSQRRYDNASRKWICGLASHGVLCQQINQISNVALKTIPETLMRCLITQTSLGTPLNLAEVQKTVPGTLFDSLLPFQRDGVAFALEKGGCALIADEMGCGKTIQALAICSCYHEEWPMLVIAPSSVRANWVEEMTRWLLIPAEDILLAKNANADLTKHSVVVMSYDLIARAVQSKRLWEGQFKVIIADESHYLKNREAKRTIAVLPLLTSATRKLLLSGMCVRIHPVCIQVMLLLLLRSAMNHWCTLYISRYAGDEPAGGALYPDPCLAAWPVPRI